MTPVDPARIPPGSRRQMEIYRAGLDGCLPSQQISLEDLDRQAQSVLEKPAYDYVAGGAGAEETVRANREAFRRWRIVPRFLRDVGSPRAGSRSSGRTVSRAGDDRARRRPVDSAQRRRPGGGSRRQAARRAGHLEHCVIEDDGGSRRRARRLSALVPTLLAQRCRAGGEPRGPRRSAPDIKPSW